MAVGRTPDKFTVMAVLSEVRVEHLLLQLAQFGKHVSDALVDAAGKDWTSNDSIVVLCALDLEGAKRPGAIQDLTGLTSGGVSKMLDRMESGGLVKRSYGTVHGDNRGVHVRITPKGRRLIGKISGELATRLPESKVLLKEIMTVLDA